MVTYTLDASAILRYLDGETGADRVADILKGHIAGRNTVIVSAIHWGEVIGVVCKLHGKQKAEMVLSRLLSFGFELVPATPERAVSSALIKCQNKIPYAGAFGVDLAGESPDHVLVTADFDVKPAEKDVHIEFLPKKTSTSRR